LKINNYFSQAVLSFFWKDIYRAKWLQADNEAHYIMSNLILRCFFFIIVHQLIAHLFNFHFLFVCTWFASLWWGLRSFSFFHLRFYHWNFSEKNWAYIHLTSHLKIICFVCRITCYFYKIDKLGVRSGGGSFILNVTSKYFSLYSDI
jgi:hypothetical protein